MPNESSPAVFLDRDGTLMHELEYCGEPELVRVFDDVPAGLRLLKAHGYKLIVITNQSGIGRGYFSEAQYRAVESELERQLGAGLIDATYFCPDAPTSISVRRKPSPEMIFEAQRQHSIDLRRSFVIGDKAIDLQCGRKAGLRTVLVRTGYGFKEDGSSASFIAQNFKSAAAWIVTHPA